MLNLIRLISHFLTNYIDNLINITNRIKKNEDHLQLIQCTGQNFNVTALITVCCLNNDINKYQVETNSMKY